MKWRKISAVLLSAAMVVTLGACSNSSDSGSSDSGEGSGTSTEYVCSKGKRRYICCMDDNRDAGSS